MHFLIPEMAVISGTKKSLNIAKTHVSCLAQGEAGSHLRETMEN